ncbi:MAG: bifunctional UDP-4-keto-pentose/UDP-xylose synthase [Candidatus Methylomirabilota bacterium]|nr:MAG: bifunctional UDP-4-keto-pentose/UDP-xylose synthase [candidate division NC10 bacterium]
MRVLVLGVGGFIGSHLAHRLLRTTEHEVAGFDLTDKKLEEVLELPRFTFRRGDVRHERDTISEMIDGTDIVVDLIAHANPSLYVQKPLEVFELNFLENLRIAQLCMAKKKHLVQFSSCEVYGKTVASVCADELQDPANLRHALFTEDTTNFILGPVGKHRWIYSCAKQLLERVLHAYGMSYGLNWTVVRPFNFIGPKIDFLTFEQEGNPRVFSNFMSALLESSPMKLVNGGHHKRCYTYIDDAIDCITRILENPGGVCDRQIFNVGSPANEISIRDLAYRMRDIYAAKFIKPGERLPEILDVDSTEFYGEGYEDSDRRIPDITKAQTLLGWQPRYDLDRTIELSIAGYANYAPGATIA